MPQPEFLRSALNKYAAPGAKPTPAAPATTGITTSGPGGGLSGGLGGNSASPTMGLNRSTGLAGMPSPKPTPGGATASLATNQMPRMSTVTTSSGVTPPPARPVSPGYNPGPSTSFINEWLNPPKPSASSGAPYQSPYLNVMDRWYNRNTKQQVTESGEQALMRTGQGALATAGLAAGVAGGITAAPTLASLGVPGAAAVNNALPAWVGASAPAAWYTAGVTPATAASAAGAVPMIVDSGFTTEPDAATVQPPAAQTEVAGDPAAATTQPAAQPAATDTQQQTTSQQPAAPQTPEQKQQAETELTAMLQAGSAPNATPEQKQAATDAAAKYVQSNLTADDRAGINDISAGNKNTPAAQAFQAKMDASGNEFGKQEYAKLLQQNPGASAQEQGGFLNQAMQSYQNMPDPMKWMMGIGVGGGLLGILGSMFGGGGGMGLLGLLGLGLGGAAGAAGGMFGQDAQNMAADAMTGIGKFIGMVPEKLTDEQKRVLLAKDPVSAIQSDKVPTRADAAKRVASGRQQMEQLGWFNRMGGMTPRMLQNMGLSPEEAQLAQQNIGALNTQYADPKSPLNAYFQRGEEYAQPTWKSFRQEWGSWLAGKRGCDIAAAWAKEARCWKGYEPVPGKAPYSDNSCRPIRSKKKKKKTEKKAETPNTINMDEWLRKYRARGQKGRWVNTQRSAKTEQKISHA